VTTVSDTFVPSTTPDGFDASGNQTAAYAPEGAPKQVLPVVAETGGFKAPGGALRPSMRDRIAARRPYTTELLYVPSWDETVEVRSISLGVRNEMMERVMDPETKDVNAKLLYPELLITTAYDPETGERIFADDDIAFIDGQDAGAADAVAKVAMKLSGMADESKDKEAGKSSATETSDSAS
jgi:hypothetical protein